MIFHHQCQVLYMIQHLSGPNSHIELPSQTLCLVEIQNPRSLESPKVRNIHSSILVVLYFGDFLCRVLGVVFPFLLEMQSLSKLVSFLASFFKTPLCGAQFLVFQPRSKDEAFFFWPISCYLLVFAAVYFHFETVDKEPTPISVLGSSNLSSFRIRSAKDPTL